MKAAVDAIGIVQLVTFVCLGVIATLRWRERGGTSRAWLAATFVSIALVSVAGRFIPMTSRSAAADWERKFLVAALLLFPYFLFRFAATFRRPGRILEIAAGALVVAASGGIFLFRRVPLAGEQTSAAFKAYIVLLIVEWAALNFLVAAWLWIGGRGQPRVARFRMRTLSIGAALLGLVIVLSGLAPSNSTTEPGVLQLVISLIGLATAPFFLLGFSPPRAVLATWRRPAELRLREAEAGLMAAMTPQEIADVLVPRVAEVMGAAGAVLVGEDGTILASSGVSGHGVSALVDEVVSSESALVIPVGGGRLAVEASSYTPFFGREEAQILGQIGRLTEVALQRARLSERERELADELRQANEAMREFVAIASHDLRTPITIVTGFASTMVAAYDSLPDESKRQNLEVIARQGEHLARLVDDLLTVSRIDAAAVPVDPVSLPIGDLAREVCRELQFDGVEIDVPDDLCVQADRDHVVRILRNYLENASRYGAPPVIVEGRAVGDDVEVRVKDRGPGVPPEFEARLFQRFARDDAAKAKDKRGTGLGLSIVRGLAEASGGSARYERNSPTGSCFVVTLPRYEEGR